MKSRATDDLAEQQTLATERLEIGDNESSRCLYCKRRGAAPAQFIHELRQHIEQANCDDVSLRVANLATVCNGNWKLAATAAG